MQLWRKYFPEVNGSSTWHLVYEDFHIFNKEVSQ